MAKLYGCAESEKEILNLCPNSVKRFEDIDIIYKDLNNQLKKEEKIFLDNLPIRIKKEEDILKNIRDEEKAIIHKFDKSVKEIEDKIKIHKQNKKWLSIISGFFQILFQKYFSKPLKLRKNKTSEINQEKYLSQWKDNSKDIFYELQSELIKKIEDFEEIKKSPYYFGAYGELKVLNELSKLNEEYSVLCGLNIELDNWHSYGGERFNLKSAQMDFVVISYKGVFLIEVKNWSNDYCNQNRNLSPYEQIDRAGKVLYNFLKSELEDDVAIQRRINKILVPIKKNISYNPKYKSVLVSNLEKINHFISNKRDVLSNYEVKKIISVLTPFVTNK